MPEDLPLTDPLVVTRRLLYKGKRDSGRLIPAPAGALHVHTSRPLHGRPLRIMQALFACVRRRDFLSRRRPKASALRCCGRFWVATHIRPRAFIRGQGPSPGN